MWGLGLGIWLGLRVMASVKIKIRVSIRETRCSDGWCTDRDGGGGIP